MKTIALVTYSQISAQEDKEILERILKSYAIIQTYCMEDGSVFTSIKADLIVVSADDMYRLAKKHAAPDAKIIVMEKTMSWDAVNKVKQLPIYSKALVVNVNLDMSRECIRQLYYLGISEIELIPYAPYIDLKSKPEIAISVGEQWAVPSFVKDVVEIGRRKIDVATIAYILVELGHPELFASEEAQAYCRQLAPIHHTNLPLPKEKSDDVFSLGEKQKGLISYNNNGKIKHYNLLAKEILGTTEEKLTGANILDIFSSLSIRQALMDMKPGQKKRFFLNGQYVQIQVFAENDTIGPRTNYMTLETLGAARERGKAPIPGRGYRAKHDFSDIITCSETMKKLMGLAERNAKKDSSILITGESGTGKELMAQAIHNASPRSREPFVAINCASLPESLLESELFGYEEGAFTGASRGGKKGLFEQANGGTLFLDEIGEMPIYLQTRLLRVLQEREVMRVGGDCVRDIDVRIVAASNRKLTRMIEEGSFRQDLY